MLAIASYSPGIYKRLPIEEHKTAIGSQIIYYETVGAGKPLLLLHGLSGSTRWWAKNIEFFSQSYRLYMIDLVGFGRGGGQKFVLRQAADLIAQWVEAMGIQPVHLIGHSMGGYISVELAARYPVLIDHLVLVDALALPLSRTIFHNTLALLQAVRFMPFDFYPVLVTDSLRAGPLALVKAIREILAADITQELQHIQAPALIVWGENDKLLPLELGVALSQELPCAALEIIPQAGHNPMWDQPEQFNQVVAQFLCARPEAVNLSECRESYVR